MRIITRQSGFDSECSVGCNKEQSQQIQEEVVMGEVHRSQVKTHKIDIKNNLYNTSIKKQLAALIVVRSSC